MKKIFYICFLFFPSLLFANGQFFSHPEGLYQIEFPYGWRVENVRGTSFAAFFPDPKPENGYTAGVKVEAFRSAQDLKSYIDTHKTQWETGWTIKKEKRTKIDGQTAYQFELTQDRHHVIKYVAKGKGIIFILTLRSSPDHLKKNLAAMKYITNSFKITAL